MPTSQKQIDANRINAQKSTGPKTEEGKARSSMNGYKCHITGLSTIMADEDSAAKFEFIAAYVNALKPEGLIEHNLATVIAHDHWRLKRIKALEENVFSYGLVLPGKVFTNDRLEIENCVGHAHNYLKHSDKINRISLYESRLNKIIHANEDRLKDLQSARRAEQPPAQPQPDAEPKAQPKTIQHFTAQNGFARANLDTVPAEPGLADSPGVKAA